MEAGSVIGAAVGAVVGCRERSLWCCMHFAGGAAMGYLFGPVISKAMVMDPGAASGMVGLFGFAIAQKLHEVIEGIDAKHVVSVIVDAIVKRLQ